VHVTLRERKPGRERKEKESRQGEREREERRGIDRV
jgi:hypothetical protein